MLSVTPDSEPPDYEGIDDSSLRRKVIGCCAILIIVVLFIALIVGYSPWFRPFFP
ncbi:MAG: hypothetical protein ACXACH_06465 [Candidatus Hermodarchaeia archaeon]|jgi:hypothetical protein